MPTVKLNNKERRANRFQNHRSNLFLNKKLT